MPGAIGKPKNRPVVFYIRFAGLFFRTHHVIKIFGPPGPFCRVFFLITLQTTRPARHFAFRPVSPAWFLSGDRSPRSTPIVVCATLRASLRLARLVFTIQNRLRALFFECFARRPRSGQGTVEGSSLLRRGSLFLVTLSLFFGLPAFAGSFS